MEWGDDYHGNRPVSVFITDDKAKECAKHLNENQVRDCGIDMLVDSSETCDHKYSYTVHELPMDATDYDNNLLSKEVKNLVRSWT